MNHHTDPRDSSELPPLAEGAVLGQQFSIMKPLGTGWAGPVYVAEDRVLGRVVAVREFFPALARRLEGAEQRQKARLLSSMHHPNVVMVHAFGTSPRGPFMVMEYHRGEPVTRGLSDANGDSLCDALLQLAGACATAHKSGLLHGNLTPDNVRVIVGRGQRRAIKVMDFGIVQACGWPGAGGPHGFPGSAVYTAPETLRGESLTERSDIYSFGILALELLTGRPLSAAPALLDALRDPDAAAHGALPGDAELPPQVLAVLRSALAARPQDRPADAWSFANELCTQIRASGAVRSSTVVSPVAGASPPPSHRTPDLSTDTTWPADGLRTIRGGRAPDLSPSSGPTGAMESGAVLYVVAELERAAGVESAEYLDCATFVAERVKAAVAPFGGIVIGPVTERQLHFFPVAGTSDGSVARAMNAALFARAAVASLKGDPGIPKGMSVTVRVGVEVGRVASLREVGVFRAALGPAVFGARRLAQSASPGEIRVSNAAYRSVRGLYQGRRVSKEASADVVILARTTAALPPPSEIYGVPVDLVGRDREIEQIRRAFSLAVERSRPIVAFVTGAAGVGKTRLVAEAVRGLHEDRGGALHVDVAHAAMNDNSPFGPFTEIVRRWARLSDDDSPAIARRKLEHYARRISGGAGARPDDVDDSMLDALEQIAWSSEETPLGHASSSDKVFHRQILDGLSWAYERHGEARPVLVVLDDLDLSSGVAREIVQHWYRSQLSLPMLVVVTARSAAAVEEAARLADPARVVTLRLEPLAGRDLRDLVCHVLQRLPRRPDWLLSQLQEISGGSPAAVEELVLDLVEEDVIRIDASGAWTLSVSSPSEVRLPRTAAQILERRLEQLPARLVRALSTASVVRDLFTEQLLAALLGDPAEGSALRELAERRLVVEVRSRHLRGEPVHAFAQSSLGELLYSRLPRAEARRLHKLAADWLERACRGSHGRFDEFIGHHFLAAGDRHHAYRYLRLASLRAARTYLVDDALRLLESCHDILQSGDDEPLGGRAERAAVLADLLEHLVVAGKLDRAIALSSDSLSNAEGARDGVGARIALARGRALEHQGRYEAALSAFEAAMAMGRADPLLALRAAVGQAGVRAKMGDRKSAVQQLTPAIDAWTGAGGEPTPAVEQALSAAHRIRANAELELGEFESAEADYRRAYDLALGASAPVESVDALNGLAALHDARRDHERAEATWTEALREAEDWNLLQQRSILLSNLGSTQLDRGLNDRALSTLQEAERLHEYLRSDQGIAHTSISLGQCRLARGDVAGALADSARALDAARSLKAPRVLGRALRLRATVLRAQGADEASIRALLVESVSVLTESGFPAEAEESARLGRELGVL
jgi:serine/threonine protein kinase/tetratricopeptide (TPR) repeat protein